MCRRHRCLRRVSLRAARLSPNGEASRFFLLHEAPKHEPDQTRQIVLRETVTSEQARPLEQFSQLGVGGEMNAKAIGGKSFELVTTRLYWGWGWGPSTPDAPAVSEPRSSPIFAVSLTVASCP